MEKPGGDGHVARVDVQFDLDAIGEVLARLVDHHVPAGHQEQALAALEEKAAGIGQQPLSFESDHPRRGQQQRISGRCRAFFLWHDPLCAGGVSVTIPSTWTSTTTRLIRSSGPTPRKRRRPWPPRWRRLLPPAISTSCAAAQSAARGAGPRGAGPACGPGPFFENLGREGFSDLNRRTVNLERQVRDNGITYNVYADANGPQRPWSLDLFPLIITPDSWQQIEAGVLQRVKLLDRIMADVYGPQQLLARNLLPPALVQGHPGYLRPMHGVKPAGGTHLHIAAFDMARDPDGDWWVVSQRTQAPSGLGYLLENRLIISRLFPEAFRDLKVQRLAATYRALVEGLRAMCPADGEPRIVLLTPGPYNETYFEHAYLARYLGLTLVEGSDLTVRDQRLYLKTLQGPGAGARHPQAPGRRVPRPAGAALRFAPGRAGPAAGHPRGQRAGGQRARARRSWNPPPCWASCRRCRATCWAKNSSCPRWPPGGAASAPPWKRCCRSCPPSVIKPTYGGAGAGAVLGKSLSRRELDEWAGRIVREAEEHTVQAYLPLSQMPTWKHGPGGRPHHAALADAARVRGLRRRRSRGACCPAA